MTRAQRIAPFAGLAFGVLLVALAMALPAITGWEARIPFDGLPDNIPNANWPVHVAGHPPGALGFFVVLDRIGLGSGWSAGVVVTLLAASTAVGVLVTFRLLGAEVVARRAAPF